MNKKSLFMHLYFWFFWTVLFGVPLFAGDPPPLTTTYVYSKEMRGSRTKTTWVLREEEEQFRIEGESVRGKTVVISNSDMDTQSFRYESKNALSAYHITRKGDYLIAERDVGGRKEQKEIYIKKSRWIQEFDFSLRPFILSSLQSLKFYIVHPQKLDGYYMQGYKQKKEQIKISGKMREALKVKLTLTGFKKMFWKAQLWFDQETGDLLKYMANEGPRTPVSTITLFSKTIQGKKNVLSSVLQAHSSSCIYGSAANSL